MEELHKTHKERSFGWVLTVQELMKAVRAHPDAAPALRRGPLPAATVLGDLHNLAGPH
ncbi:MAG: hypothetical protein JSR86_19535 [Proteobacteria bacterium]|nr:hypothetical protein [Pseudomonadota bacterium]